MITYLMIYLPEGLPIFSKCMGDFCKEANFNEDLLIGFIRALETLPNIVGTQPMDAVDLGNTKLVYNKILPSGISVVIGIPDETDVQAAQDVLKAIQSLIKDHYRNHNWKTIRTEVFTEFKKSLYEILGTTLHKYGGFEDQCPLGDECPMYMTAADMNKQPIWDRIRTVYDKIQKDNPA